MKVTHLALCALVLVSATAAQEEEPTAEEPSGKSKSKKKSKDGEEEEVPKVDPERYKLAEGKAYCEYDNCYKLLSTDEIPITRDSGPIVIKRAWRKLSKLYHPDTCASGDVEVCKEEFPKYANAHEILSSSEMRKNYNYVLDNPYEFPGFYMKYSSPAYAPKSDLRFVILVTLIGASVMQFLLKKSQHEQAFSALKRAPTTRYQEKVKEAMVTLGKAKPKAESKEATPPPSPAKKAAGAAAAKKPTKQEKEEVLRKEAEELVDAELLELMGAGPSPCDLLAVDVFKLPITTLYTVKWVLAGGMSDPGYKTRKALGLSAAEWDACEEEEKAELVGKELWLSANLEEYEAGFGAGKAVAKSKSGKEKRAARQAKKNPGAVPMDD